jgi:hypothetical protein
MSSPSLAKILTAPPVPLQLCGHVLTEPIPQCGRVALEALSRFDKPKRASIKTCCFGEMTPGSYEIVWQILEKIKIALAYAERSMGSWRSLEE